MTVHGRNAHAPSEARPNRLASRRIAGIALVVAGALTAVACSSSAGNSTSTDSSTGSAAGSVANMSVAYLGASAGLMPEVMIANDPGQCAQYGVKPKMQIINQGTAPAALAAGQVQALRSGVGSFLIAASQDSAATSIVGAFGPLPLALFVTKDINSVEDLKGKTIGAPAKGSTSDVSIRELLAEHGLTVGTDVKITYAGSSSALFGEAASGAIQGFLYSPPVPPVAGSTGVHELLSTKGIATIENLNKTVIGVTSSFLKKNETAVKGFLACLGAAAKQIAADPAQAAPMLAKAESISTDQAAAQIQAQVSAGSYAMIPFTVQDAQAVMSELEKFGVAKFDSFDPAAVINNSLLPTS